MREYDMFDWLCCPECGERDPRRVYSNADDGTSLYECENCGERVEII